MAGGKVAMHELAISPTDKQQRVIFFIVVGIMGAMGVFALYLGVWSTNIWWKYGLINLLLTAFISTYQSEGGYNLVVSTILLIPTMVFSIMLASGINLTTPYHPVLNLSGIIEAWSLIWSVYVLNQILFYSFRMSQRKQNKCFFISTISLVVLMTVIKKVLMGMNYINLAGFVLASFALIGLMYLRQREVYAVN